MVAQATNGGNFDVRRLAVAKRYIRMVQDGKHISFSLGNITLVSQLIPGSSYTMTS